MITVRRTIAISGVLLAVSACIPFDIAQAAKPVFRTIYNFSGPDGQFPLSALIMGQEVCFTAPRSTVAFTTMARCSH
jgi:hypothetical protein